MINVNLRMNEEYKHKVIKKLAETIGNKKAASMKILLYLHSIFLPKSVGFQVCILNLHVDQTS